MGYSLEFRPSVLKGLKQLSQKDLRRIKKKLDDLAKNLPDSAIKKMKGNDPFHKIRSSDYRIIFEIHDDRLVILVVKIGHCKDVYKRLL